MMVLAKMTTAKVCSVTVVLLATLVAVAQARAYYDAIVIDAESRSDDEPEVTRRRVTYEDCLLPRVSGHCRAFFQSYYYNRDTKKCELFVYTGCGGNNNRFDSQSECEQHCSLKNKEGVSEQLNKRCNRDVIPPVCNRGCRLEINTNIATRNRRQKSLDHREVTSSSRNMNVCSLPAVRGHCRALLSRWRYDPATGKCSEFKFGGCDGNGNNFRTEQQCMKACGGF
ncbi:hypothetical protein C0J52_27116 [Blattella germanica]|nr:hypothetical protein C0J52_27116 [Blattella germanica]